MLMHHDACGMRRSLLLVGLTLVLVSTGRPARAVQDAPAEPEIVPSATARERIGERCTVELTVRAANNNERRLSYFLDSEERFSDPNNLAIVISYRDAAAFREAGIENPAEHFKGKTIRVTGRVVHEPRVNQVRIYVTEPTQIEVVKTALDQVNAPPAGEKP